MIWQKKCILYGLYGHKVQKSIFGWIIDIWIACGIAVHASWMHFRARAYEALLIFIYLFFRVCELWNARRGEESEKSRFLALILQLEYHANVWAYFELWQCKQTEFLSAISLCVLCFLPFFKSFCTCALGCQSRACPLFTFTFTCKRSNAPKCPNIFPECLLSNDDFTLV